MKVALFTYKSLKELLGKPSEDATRKWVESRGLKRRNKENTNLKEVLVPYDMYQKLWESAGKPQEFSNPPTEEIPEEEKKATYEDENIVTAEFSRIPSYEIHEDSNKTSFALTTEFAENYLNKIASQHDALMEKNDSLYSKITELSRYEERASILEKEISKKEELLDEYHSKIENLNTQLREYDVLKVKIGLIKELADLKESEASILKEKIDLLNQRNKELEDKLTQEKNKLSWMKKFVGI